MTPAALAASAATASSMRQRLGVDALGERRIDVAVVDVGAETALLDGDRAAQRRVFADQSRRAPKRDPPPLSLATIRSMARLAPISNTSSSRPGWRRSCRAAHRRRICRCRPGSARRKSGAWRPRVAKRAAPAPFRASRPPASGPAATTSAWACRLRPAGHSRRSGRCAARFLRRSWDPRPEP